jgi:glycosyltransferase involved in cell wall biosynthesis
VIAGDGPYRQRLARAIDEAGIAPFVHWIGRPPDPSLHGWYEAADLFVHPTLYEGSSLVTLEAMAHRRPVVATRAGGLPDKIEPGISGWLVPSGDAPAMAAAIEDAVSHREAWPAMGAAGRAHVERTFDWPVVERAMRGVYEDVLAKPQRPRLSLGQAD